MSCLEVLEREKVCECDMGRFCRLCVCVEVMATHCGLQSPTELDQTRTGRPVHATTELRRQSMVADAESMVDQC